MITKRQKTTPNSSAPENENAKYWHQQSSASIVFRSPFAMLNITLQDCNQQRIECGISDADLARDIAIFTAAIDGHIATNGYPDTNQKVDSYLGLAHEFVSNGMRDSRYPQNHWPLIACHVALLALREAQQKKGFIVDAAMTNVALFAQGMMNIAWKPERMRRSDELTREFAHAANKAKAKEDAHSDQIKEAQKAQAKARHEAALGARQLVIDTLYPEWRKANQDADKTTGYRHCANVLTGRGYKSANGTPITWMTVKAYFRKTRTSTEPSN